MGKSTDSENTTPPTSAVIGGASIASSPSSVNANNGVANQCVNTPTKPSYLMAPPPPSKTIHKIPTKNDCIGSCNTNNKKTSIGCGSSSPPSKFSMPSTRLTPSASEIKMLPLKEAIVSSSKAVNIGNFATNATNSITSTASTNSLPTSLTTTFTSTPNTTPMNEAVSSSVTQSTSSSSNISTSISTTSIASAIARHGTLILPSTVARTVTPTSNGGTTFASTTLQHTISPHAVQLPHINLNINTTTGGNFGVTVDPQISVENLKKIIGKKLKVAKDRICLLHRERELQDGTLKDNNLMDGSRIILIPNVETGLLAQRPENTVMQALESLNDSQVNDFLSGKTPLNLSMRLGDHMMLIQLQLSTVNPANGTSTGNGSNTNTCSSNPNTSAALRARSNQRNNRSVLAAAGNSHNHHHHHHHHHHHQASAAAAAAAAATSSITSTTNTRSTTIYQQQMLNGGSTVSSNTSITAGSAVNTDNTINTNNHATSYATTKSISNTNGNTLKSSDLSALLSKRDYENLQNIVKSIAMSQPARLTSQPIGQTLVQQLRQCASNVISNKDGLSLSEASSSSANFSSSTAVTNAPNASTTTESDNGIAKVSASASALLEQSPIKSLSNLVSSPIKTAAIKSIPIVKDGSVEGENSAIESTCPDPIAAKLTSCLCTRLNAAGSSGGIGIVSASDKDNCMDTTDCSTDNNNSVVVTSLNEAMIVDNSIDAQPQLTTLQKLVATGSGSANNSNNNSNISATLHKTANNPIMRSKNRSSYYHHHHHHHYHHQQQQSQQPTQHKTLSPILRPKVNTSSPMARPMTMSTNNMDDSGLGADSDISMTNATNTPTPSTVEKIVPTTTETATEAIQTSNVATTSTSASASVCSSSNSKGNNHIVSNDNGVPASDSRTLAEASRNLTQTLRKLSKEVFTNKIDLSGGEEAASRKGGSGAVIESMKNHGKGIYSGTFSGTLNPALQDRYGRPKRDISTVIHILNDLLSATPQYSRGARISFEAPNSSSSSTTSGGISCTNGGNGVAVHGIRSSKQLTMKNHHHLHHNHHHHHYQQMQHTHACVKCLKSQQQHGSGNSSTCNYGESSGHYANGKTTTIGRNHASCCRDVASASNNGANHTSCASGSNNTNNNILDERNICNCRYRNNNETGEREREQMCQKCITDLENSKTKTKIDQLRQVMLQSKQRREARKLKGLPYITRATASTPTTKVANSNENVFSMTNNTTAASIVCTNTTATTTTATNGISSSAPVTSSSTLSTTNTPQLAATASTSNNSNNATTKSTKAAAKTATTTPNEVSPNHIVEEVDTAA